MGTKMETVTTGDKDYNSNWWQTKQQHHLIDSNKVATHHGSDKNSISNWWGQNGNNKLVGTKTAKTAKPIRWQKWQQSNGRTKEHKPMTQGSGRLQQLYCSAEVAGLASDIWKWQLIGGGSIMAVAGPVGGQQLKQGSSVPNSCFSGSFFKSIDSAGVTVLGSGQRAFGGTGAWLLGISLL